MDRRQIESIKKHFAEKSKAELQDIIKLQDRERWSDDAFVAAEEVLNDRAEGRASEPIVAELVQLPPLSIENRSEINPFASSATDMSSHIGAAISLSRSRIPILVVAAFLGIVSALSLLALGIQLVNLFKYSTMSSDGWYFVG